MSRLLPLSAADRLSTAGAAAIAAAGAATGAAGLAPTGPGTWSLSGTGQKGRAVRRNSTTCWDRKNKRDGEHGHGGGSSIGLEGFVVTDIGDGSGALHFLVVDGKSRTWGGLLDQVVLMAKGNQKKGDE